MLQLLVDTILEHSDNIKARLDHKIIGKDILIGRLNQQFDLGWSHKTLRISKKGTVSSFYLNDNYGGRALLGNDVDLGFLKGIIPL